MHKLSLILIAKKIFSMAVFQVPIDPQGGATSFMSMYWFILQGAERLVFLNLNFFVGYKNLFTYPSHLLLIYLQGTERRLNFGVKVICQRPI